MSNISATDKRFIGQIFGRWTTIKFSHYTKIKTTGAKGPSYFLCRCVCGNEKVVCRNALLNGQSTSCGCKLIEFNKSRVKHGLSKHALYKVWGSMKQRCYNKNNESYLDYGARGIRVCNEWKDDFIEFYNWAIKNGWNDKLTIERKNFNKNYTPSNCLFIPLIEQPNNTRNNVFIKMNGERLNISQWAKKLNISKYILYDRRRLGWDDIKILTTPQLIIKNKIKKQTTNA